MKKWCYKSSNEQETVHFGKQLGAALKGGEIIELSSDLGGGKTTLTKGIVAGVNSKDVVSSPTFTLSNEYNGTELTVYHYDFYRLDELGVMKDEIIETMRNPKGVSIVEWAGEAHDLFPKERLIRVEISLVADDETAREFAISVGDLMEKQLESVELKPC